MGEGRLEARVLAAEGEEADIGVFYRQGAPVFAPATAAPAGPRTAGVLDPPA
ncbi:hypothetical protein [Streptomyces zinciresistens]|uniref:hypothetical protein n=1 Tax=Streptomyces zinciresistens TaxID=1073330 RepID=UPI00142F2BA7|nr:hypothetical protein [Streptomyces zinciresistens]